MKKVIKLSSMVMYLSKRQGSPHPEDHEDPGHEHDDALSYSVGENNSDDGE